MELKGSARVHGQWGDEAARDQPAGGTGGSAINCLDLKATPDPPGGSAQAEHLTHSPPARGVHTSMGWDRKNWLGSNSLPVSQRVHKVSRILRWVFNRA